MGEALALLRLAPIRDLELLPLGHALDLEAKALKRKIRSALAEVAVALDAKEGAAGATALEALEEGGAMAAEEVGAGPTAGARAKSAHAPEKNHQNSKRMSNRLALLNKEGPPLP